MNLLKLISYKYFRRAVNRIMLQYGHCYSTNIKTERKNIVFTVQKFMPELLEEKVQFWMKKYEDIFGITKIAELHTKVLKMKEEIHIIQEKRRQVQENIFITQKKLQESHDILHKVSIGDDMYITLVTQVRDLLKEQKQLQEGFSLYDQTEREYLSNLFMAINSSQDHEKTSREKHKYVSLIIGFTGGLLGLIASTIHNWRHRKGIKASVTNLSKDIELAANDISKNISFIATDLRNDMKQLKKQYMTQQQLLEDLDLIFNGKVPNSDNDSDIQVKQMIYKLNENVDSKLKFYTSLNIGFFTSLLIIGSFLLYISNSK